ncbi:hypothetical protein RJ641_003393, partial [Dillenia turbinata]
MVKLNFGVTGDEIFQFVLLLQYTTPSAIVLEAIGCLRSYAIQEASTLLFWQHGFTIFSHFVNI